MSIHVYRVSCGCRWMQPGWWPKSHYLLVSFYYSIHNTYRISIVVLKLQRYLCRYKCRAASRYRASCGCKWMQPGWWPKSHYLLVPFYYSIHNTYPISIVVLKLQRYLCRYKCRAASTYRASCGCKWMQPGWGSFIIYMTNIHC